MADEQFESLSQGASEAPTGDPVTAEFVSGVDRPSTSANGYGAEAESPFDENPEMLVGAAFVGGFLFGKLVRRFGS
ncbi:MAG: hypothetical protein WBD55_12230 [Dehalococcoidia bacterium]